MSSNKTLTVSLVVPLMAVSVSAYAGSTITDKSYWPIEAKQSAQARSGSPQGHLNSAFAYDRTPSGPQSAPNSHGGSAWRYQGGPKSR